MLLNQVLVKLNHWLSGNDKEISEKYLVITRKVSHYSKKRCEYFFVIMAAINLRSIVRTIHTFLKYSSMVYKMVNCDAEFNLFAVSV